MTVFCIECGARVEDTDPYCEHCGAAQEIDDTPAPAPSLPTAAVVAVAPPEPPPAPPPPPEPVLAPPPPAPPAPPPPPVAAPLPPAAASVRQSAPVEIPPAPDPFCTACGRPLAPEFRFCGACGAERRQPGATASPPPAAEPPPAPPPPPRTTVPTAAEWQPALPGRIGKLPVDLLAVCALMVLAGVLTLVPAARAVPGMFDLLGAGDSLSRAFGLLLAIIWVLLAFFGTACLVLAWRLGQADRVGRGLTYVLLGSLSASLLLEPNRSTELTLVMLVSAGAAGVLAFSPGCRAHFSGGYQGAHPEGLVIARTLVAVWAGIMGLVGLLFLPLGSLGGKFVAVGLVMLGLGAAAFYLNNRLGTGDPVARVLVTAGGAVYLVLLLVLGQRTAALILPLAMVAGIGAFLWIPQDVQRFFAGRTR